MPIADNPIVTREIAVAVVFLQPQCNMTCTFCVTEDDFEPIRFEDAVDLLGHLVQCGVRSVVLGPAQEQVPSLDGSRRPWRRCSSSTYP